MTEERNCGTCGLSSYNNVDKKGCGARGVSDCVRHSKWQPIQKAPFQITEEEARKILEVATILRVRGDMEIWIGNLKHAGYIRKSELVELVEEAEGEYKKWLTRTDDNMSETMVMDKFNKALQALKKDHPEFGGKI